jgi:hypothetical protein
MSRRRKHGMDDIDYEELANRVAERVWNVNVTTTTGTGEVSFPQNTHTGDPPEDFRFNPNTFRVDPILQPYPMYELTVHDPRIAALEAKIQELTETLKMVGQLLDEHIKRTNPIPTDRARRSIIIEEE